MAASQEQVLSVFIPYRLDAIATLTLAVCLRSHWGKPKLMEIYFDNQLQITGNSNAFMNHVIDAGLIHCRVLLEFLGLQVSTMDPTKLTARKRKRHPDDRSPTVCERCRRKIDPRDRRVHQMQSLCRHRVHSPHRSGRAAAAALRPAQDRTQLVNGTA
jgi:hypothetical protein